MSARAYDLVRSLVERLGGSMRYEREGSPYGAWVIGLGDKSAVIRASGNQSFPELDCLLTPKVPNPQTWDDYTDELLPDAEARLLRLLGLSDAVHHELENIIARAQWKFAWTYARTYPHEYTTKTQSRCDLADHARLIECIEQYGVLERFGKRVSKYLYFGERKYWHMGDPESADPKEWPNVINCTWLDVRRHAANVSHVWNAEEVELQMRIWEIQLEKVGERR